MNLPIHKCEAVLDQLTVYQLLHEDPRRISYVLHLRRPYLKQGQSACKSHPLLSFVS